MRNVASLLSRVGAAVLAAGISVPVAAQNRLSPQQAKDLVNEIISDPAKRTAVCDYHRASQGIGAAQKDTGVVVGRNPISRDAQRQQNEIDSLRRLGTAQMETRAAADRVDPRFHSAMETLRISGDFMAAIGATIRMQQLCAPQ